MKQTNRVSIEFSLLWKSKYGTHKDRYFAAKIDSWRDIFPSDLKENIFKLEEKKTYKQNFKPGILTSSYKTSNIIEFKKRALEQNHKNSKTDFCLGRFYPKGIAWSGLKCFKDDINPFRLVDMKDGIFTADTNHPLSKYPLGIKARLTERLNTFEERGGECNDIAELVTNNGPGMQIPYPDLNTDFYTSYPFKRTNEDNDSIFYQSERMVNHLDTTAINQVKDIYSQNLFSGMKILDLMSSWTSHIPANIKNCHITGLGLNKKELQANKQLSEIILHDLNLDIVLPLKDNQFDAVICTSSIEYLIRPLEIIKEVARVLKPQGVLIIVFSNRWFEGKQIISWSDMHDFERLGYVLDLYLKSDEFDNLQTESIRGLQRPLDDKYINERLTSDPVFAVLGKKKKCSTQGKVRLYG